MSDAEKGGGEVTTSRGPCKRGARSALVKLRGGEAKCAAVYRTCSDSVRLQRTLAPLERLEYSRDQRHQR